jgi:hypothetical protein
MATTTTNFGWDIPQSTDLVKDGATAIAALGQDIDTAFVDFKGGTTGQVLKKTSGTDLDVEWGTVSSGLTLINTTSFSAVSAFNLAADTFTTTYTNYFILFDATTSQSSEIYARLRAAGVNATGNDYNNQWVRGLTASVGGNAYTSTAANVNVADGAGKHVLEIYVYSPKLAVPTRLTSKFQSVAKPGLGISAISHSLSTAYDSLSIYPDSGGTITGKASVYGFNE